MPRKSGPVEPIFHYFVDHALTIQLRRVNIITPINPLGTDYIVQWEYKIIFGATKRGLFTGRDFVTYYNSPEEAAGELIRALDVSLAAYGHDFNDAQYAFMKDIQPRYAAMFNGGGVDRVPGAEFRIDTPKTSESLATEGIRQPVWANTPRPASPEENAILQVLSEIAESKTEDSKESVDTA